MSTKRLMLSAFLLLASLAVVVHAPGFSGMLAALLLASGALILAPLP